MSVERHDNIIHRHTQLFRRRADNAQVSLMRYQPVQRRTVEIIGFQRFINDVRKLGHRDFKYFVTRHRQMNRVFWVHAIGVRQRQQFAIATVGVQMRGENARSSDALQYNRARPITENDDRSAIG